MPFYILLLRPDVKQFELIKFARHPEKIPSGKILLEQTLKSASHPEFLAQQHDGFYCLETKKEILFADEEKGNKKIKKKRNKKQIKKITSETTACCVSKEDEDEKNKEQQEKIVHLEDKNSTTTKTEEDKELTQNQQQEQQQPEPEEDAEDRLLASLLEDDEEEKEEDSAAAAAAEDGVVAAETTNVDDPDVTREPEEFSEAANEEDHEDEESEENDGTEEEENHPFATIGPILVAIPTGFPIQQVDQMSRVIMASSSFQILTTGDDILNKIENTSTTQQELEELHRLAKTTIGTEQFIAQHITANARSNEAYEQQVQDLEDRRTKGAKTRRSSSSSFASTTGSPSSHGVGGGWDGSLDLCSSFPSPNAARTSIIVAPRPSVSRPDTHGLSPVDAMRVAQNQQRSQARQNEQATKQQYQLFNSSASSFGSSSSPRPSPMAVTPPSSAKSVVTIDTDTPSIQSSSSSRVRKQSIDAKKEQELTLIRQARRDGTPSGSSTKSCTSFGSASFSESSEHKLVRSFWKSPAIFFSLFFFVVGFLPNRFCDRSFFFPDRLMSCPFVLCFVGLGGLV